MKILLINKFHYRRGGSETYYFALAEALCAMGHEVVFFAMQDDKNEECATAEYFVSNKDYNNSTGFASKVKAVTDFFYSGEAAEKMEKLIQKEKPDIAHVSLLHRQITFSVIDVLKKHNIPVVMTMHDLIFVCPNYTMINNGVRCESCLDGSVLNCIKSKCIKNSAAKSALGAFEKVYLIKKKYYDLIDLYIAPCNMFKNLMEKSGFTSSPIKAMTNFLPMSCDFGFEGSYEDYILYFGRLSEGKGVLTLLKAHMKSGCKRKLMIVGAGPLEDEIKKYIENNNLTNIELTGALYGKDLSDTVTHARVVVVPSEWYENCPYSILESLAKGKIVIAGNIGGLGELIDDKNTGFLFEPGNPDALNCAIDRVFNMSKDDYESMSKRIVVKAKERHHWEKYMNTLLDEYSRLIEKHPQQ